MFEFNTIKKVEAGKFNLDKRYNWVPTYSGYNTSYTWRSIEIPFVDLEAGDLFIDRTDNPISVWIKTNNHTAVELRTGVEIPDEVLVTKNVERVKGTADLSPVAYEGLPPVAYEGEVAE